MSHSSTKHPAHPALVRDLRSAETTVCGPENPPHHTVMASLRVLSGYQQPISTFPPVPRHRHPPYWPHKVMDRHTNSTSPFNRKPGKRFLVFASWMLQPLLQIFEVSGLSKPLRLNDYTLVHNFSLPSSGKNTSSSISLILKALEMLTIDGNNN